MKKTISALLVLSTFSVFAAGPKDNSCAAEAKAVAKMNLDQVASKINNRPADVIKPAILIGTKESKVGSSTDLLSVYRVLGSIYKADYSVVVALDEDCAVRELSIELDSDLNANSK